METFKAHPQLGRFTLRDEGDCWLNQTREPPKVHYAGFGGLVSDYYVMCTVHPGIFRNNDCDRKDPEGGGIDSDFGCFCDQIIYAGEQRFRSSSSVKTCAEVNLRPFYWP